MGRMIKYLFYLILIGAAGLAVYALLAPLPAPQEDRVIPVTLPER